VHSSLLIAISWLAPFFILKKLKPSLEKSAFRGLNQGLALAMHEIENTVTEVIKDIRSQHDAQAAQLEEIIAQCNIDEPSQVSSAPSKSPLTRMLVDDSLLPAE
jgi:hypothetical protein